MKPPNHGLLHLVTVVEEVGEDAYLGAEFEGYLVLAHPGQMFTGLALVNHCSPPPLLIDHTDRIEVLL